MRDAMKVTADTITDEQLRGLMSWARNADEANEAWFALYGTTFGGRREQARARCAEILNTHCAESSP